MHGPTRRLTECSLLTAFSVVLHLSTLVWGLGLATVLLAGLPSVYVAMVHGARWAAASTAAATVLVGLVAGPLEACAFVCVFAVTGVTMGLLVRRGATPSSVLLGTALAVLVATLVMTYGVERLLGLDEMLVLLADLRSGVEAAAAAAAAFVGRSAPPPGLALLLDAFMTMPLALFACLSFLVAYATFMASALVFPRLGLPFEELPDPRRVRAPRVLAIVVLADLVLGLASLAPAGALRVAAANLVVGCWLWLYVAGLSLLLAAMDGRLRHPLPRLLLTALAVLPLAPLTAASAAVSSFLSPSLSSPSSS